MGIISDAVNRGHYEATLPLQNGDRMARPEFERRYSAMTDVKKAELVEGRVYIPSPVHFPDHGAPHFAVVGWLACYCAATPGVHGADNTSVQINWHNEPQPDALLILSPEMGGQARIGKSRFVEGPPELIVEIAASSASYDLHDKLQAYERNGVQEYIVWRTRDREIDWFELLEGRYVRQAPDSNGILRSRVFPGLWLDPSALIAGDLARVFQLVQQGVATPEHARFVQRDVAEPSDG